MDKMMREEATDPALLVQLHETSVRLHSLLQQLPAQVPGQVSDAAAPPPVPTPSARPAHLKRLLQLRARRRRASYGAFMDWPSWDMLLDLAAVKGEGSHITVSSLCISSGAPQSTALRKLSALEEAGWVRRYLHGRDRRRICLTLSDEANEVVTRLIAENLSFYAEVATAMEAGTARK